MIKKKDLLLKINTLESQMQDQTNITDRIIDVTKDSLSKDIKANKRNTSSVSSRLSAHSTKLITALRKVAKKHDKHSLAIDEALNLVADELERK